MPTYATAEEYLDYTGQSGPADIDRRLARASERVDELLAEAIYEVDDQEFALDPVLKKAMMQATCVQAAWTLAVGDEFGTASAFKDVSMGSVRLARVDSKDGTAPRYAQDAVSILLRAGFLIAVMTW
ncbi:hypothetical protein [Nonomuraea cavernae]|uniref:Uncharacterized protein n=1 Tax=Nonomuraea cavernae TaxID=2045107 RepID=A0A917YQ42_9ACTN|nr:hypothetical protein [Nonomuraea cavernae]MCA2184640.1 hypothetical protein [Nonomuraea cavernae]GGO63202.1 hypothetical protein GCM10012289_09590 [Nonomuraea cavernae]